MSWVAVGVTAVAAGTAGYKMYQANKQKKAGEKALKKLVKPTYKIPEEIRQNLKESELRALEGLPTEQKMEYVKNIERSQQNALQESADRKGGLLGLQDASRQATDAFTRLTSMDAEARAINQQKVQQNRLILADAKDKEFGYGQANYQQELASAQAMIGAGSQNYMNGLDEMGGAAISAGSAYSTMNSGGGNRTRNQATVPKTKSLSTKPIGASSTTNNTSSSMRKRNGVGLNDDWLKTTNTMYDNPYLFNF